MQNLTDTSSGLHNASKSGLVRIETENWILKVGVWKESLLYIKKLRDGEVNCLYNM